MPRLNPREGVRGALLHTLPGRAIVVGTAIKAVVVLIRSAAGAVPAFLNVIETVAGFAVAAGLVYFGFRLGMVAKRRLLWRVRRKLLVSYLFVGVLPATLLAGFSLLCGFLLFYNLSSYLVQSRLRALSDQARFTAQMTAVEIQKAAGQDVKGIVARRQAGLEAQYPSASIAVLSVDPDCHSAAPRVIASAGPWSHVPPPKTVPEWIPCSGFGGVLTYVHPRNTPADVDTHLLVRGVAFPDMPRPPYLVVVDLLVN